MYETLCNFPGIFDLAKVALFSGDVARTRHTNSAYARIAKFTPGIRGIHRPGIGHITEHANPSPTGKDFGKKNKTLKKKIYIIFLFESANNQSHSKYTLSGHANSFWSDFDIDL